MQTKALILAAMAITSAIAGLAPTKVGIEVVRRDDGTTIVREVARELKRSNRDCQNCVNVGDSCVIGEGNCKGSQHGSCTYCAPGRIICVDSVHGSCDAP